MFHFSWHVLWACKCWFRLFVLKRVCVTFICTCVSPSWWQWLWKCDHCLLTSFTYTAIYRLPWFYFTESLQTQMTQTRIPSFTDIFLMKTQEWKDCYVHRNIGIRGSNAKYETGMKELRSFALDTRFSLRSFALDTGLSLRSFALDTRFSLRSFALDTALDRGFSLRSFALDTRFSLRSFALDTRFSLRSFALDTGTQFKKFCFRHTIQFKKFCFRRRIQFKKFCFRHRDSV